MTENVHVCFEVHIEKNWKLKQQIKVSLFVLYISDTVGRNFASKVHTVIKKFSLETCPGDFMQKLSKFCVCFEVHIPVGLLDDLVLPVGKIQSGLCE